MSKKNKSKTENIEAVEVVEPVEAQSVPDAEAPEAPEAPEVEEVEEARTKLKNTLPNTFMITGAVKAIGYADFELTEDVTSDKHAMAKIARAVEIGVLEWR